MDDGGKPENEGDKKVVHVYPLVKVNWKIQITGPFKDVPLLLIFPLKHSDMNDEMRAEAIDLTITACEKFAQNYEVSVSEFGWHSETIAKMNNGVCF